MTESPALTCRDLTKRFGTVTALDGFDFSANSGKIFGLVGGNGGSKTTAMRLMAGVLTPDRGECRIFGQQPRQMRQWIGYMPQRTALHPTLSVRENLAARAAMAGLARADTVARAALDRYGLDRYGMTAAGHLSGGWARRVQFAAAVIHAPRIVLLDEPTVGLDAASRQAMWRDILDLAAAGTAVVVSTHDLAEAERFDHLAFLVQGRLRAAGPPGAVIARAKIGVVQDAGARDSLVALSRLPGFVSIYPAIGGSRIVLRRNADGTLPTAAGGLPEVPASLDDAAVALLAEARPES